jgi:hypothetical protein
MRPLLTDSKHFRKDQFEIDLLANGGKGSVTCPAGTTTSDFRRMARDGKYRPVELFHYEWFSHKQLSSGQPSGL